MTKRLRSLISGFRIPSLSAMIAEVEQVYLNAADTPAEREQRRREIASGRFRQW